MAPPKKAAKHAAKKAAKKSAKHKGPRDARRAYEHLGRIEILQTVSGHLDGEVSMLLNAAQAEMKACYPEDAADILRAAEHLSFAFVSERSSINSPAPPAALEREISAEIEHLSRRATENAEEDGYHYPELIALSRSMLKRAKAALKHGSYRQALELARGAEALSIVSRHTSKRLGKDETQARLT